MDSLTQAALGAAVGEVVLGKKLGNKASILGAVVATVPDLDILLTPLFNDLQRVSLHRGYSHSILFCILGAFLFAALFKKVKWTKEIAYGKLWLFNFLALFTHVLLDAFTSYGTQLFLPFTDWRVSFDSIGIIDPVYTIPLILGLCFTYYNRRKGFSSSTSNVIGMAVSSLYLLYTLGVKHHINNVIKAELTEHSIRYDKLLSVPVGAGSLKWFGVAKTEDSLYIGKISDLTHNHISFSSFAINNDLLDGVDDELVDRMKWFAQDFYTVAEKDGKIRIYNMQCDMQGTRAYGDYKAPTAFYFEIDQHADGTYELTTGMHKKEKK